MNYETVGLNFFVENEVQLRVHAEKGQNLHKLMYGRTFAEYFVSVEAHHTIMV